MHKAVLCMRMTTPWGLPRVRPGREAFRTPSGTVLPYDEHMLLYQLEEIGGVLKSVPLYSLVWDSYRS